MTQFNKSFISFSVLFAATFLLPALGLNSSQAATIDLHRYYSDAYVEVEIDDTVGGNNVWESDSGSSFVYAFVEMPEQDPVTWAQGSRDSSTLVNNNYAKVELDGSHQAWVVDEYVAYGSGYIGQYYTMTVTSDFGGSDPVGADIMVNLSDPVAGIAEFYIDNPDTGERVFAWEAYQGDGYTESIMLSYGVPYIIECLLDFDFMKTGGVGSPYIDIDITSSLEILIAENPVPIPGALWLLGSGLIAMMGLRRRKNRNAPGS